MRDSEEIKHLFEQIGLNHKYQYMILYLFVYTYICTEFFIVSLPFLEMKPYAYIEYFDFKQTKLYQKLNYTICDLEEKGELRYIIDKEINPRSSLVIDLGIYCNESQTSLIAISLFSGLFLGGSSAYLLLNNFGRRNTLLTVLPLYLASLLGFFYLPYNNRITFLMLFFIGFLVYNLVICMVSYLCEIIQDNKIPVFIVILISGIPIGGLTYDVLFFAFRKMSWRYILLIIIGIGLIVYLCLILYMVENPFYYYHTNKRQHFKESIRLLALRNGRILDERSKKFLKSFSMPSDELIPEDEHKENFIMKKSTKHESIAKYSPLDLLRYRSQITNFFILSFLWIIGAIIIHGFNIYIKDYSLHEGTSFSIVSAISFFADLVSNMILLALILTKNFNEYSSLITLQLISFILLMFSLLFEVDYTPYHYFFISLVCSKMCWHCIEIILYIFTSQIYPLTLRTIGLGCNKGIGKLGGILGPLLVEHSIGKSFITYYIVFICLGIIFTFVLPEKVKVVHHAPENEHEIFHKETINTNIMNEQEETFSSEEEYHFDLNPKKMKE